MIFGDNEETENCWPQRSIADLLHDNVAWFKWENTGKPGNVRKIRRHSFWSINFSKWIKISGLNSDFQFFFHLRLQHSVPTKYNTVLFFIADQSPETTEQRNPNF